MERLVLFGSWLQKLRHLAVAHASRFEAAKFAKLKRPYRPGLCFVCIDALCVCELSSDGDDWCRSPEKFVSGANAAPVVLGRCPAKLTRGAPFIVTFTSLPSFVAPK